MKNNEALLAEAIDALCPHLMEEMTPDEKFRSFAATCIAVSDIATWDTAETALGALAHAIGLTEQLGASGEADVQYVIRCAMRNALPFA